MSFNEISFYEMSFYVKCLSMKCLSMKCLFEISFYEMSFYEMSFYEISQRHIYLYALLVCQTVCQCPINVKMAEPIQSKFCVGTYMTSESQERFMDDQNFKIWPRREFDFHYVLKLNELKVFLKPQFIKNGHCKISKHDNILMIVYLFQNISIFETVVSYTVEFILI